MSGRLRHDFVPLPMTQDPADVFALHPAHRRQVASADPVADYDAPRRAPDEVVRLEV